MRAGMYVYRAEGWVNRSSCTGQETALEGLAEGPPLRLRSGLAFRVSLRYSEYAWSRCKCVGQEASFNDACRESAVAFRVRGCV